MLVPAAERKLATGSPQRPFEDSRMSPGQTLRRSIRKTLRSVGLENVSLEADRRFTLWRKRSIVDALLHYPTYDDRTRYEAVRSADPVRYSTIALALSTIDRESVAGSLAEVGVFQGVTARFIRLASPQRTFYLFDTFAGFPDRDLEVATDERFRDTSVDAVKRMVGDTSRVVIRQGTFPETAAGLEPESFAFVSLDADLYNPTLAGLQFFYSRLSPGGYIFLHDHTSPESNHAVSRACVEFLADKPEKLIELPDRFGTAILRKGSRPLLA
jgi:O-methyltransferase